MTQGRHALATASSDQDCDVSWAFVSMKLLMKMKILHPNSAVLDISDTQSP